MAIDPVCEMQVEESTARWTFEHQGDTYYFCSPGCRHAFEENPGEFVSDPK